MELSSCERLWKLFSLFSENGTLTDSCSLSGSGLFSGNPTSVSFEDTETPAISLFALSSMMAMFYWMNSLKTGELSSL